MAFAMFRFLFSRKSGPFLRGLTLLYLGSIVTTAWGQTPSRFEEWRALIASDGTNYPPTRYAAFLAQKPDWPLQKRIESRYERALLAEPDPTVRQTLCPSRPIQRADLLATCAPFLPNLAQQARRLWREQPMDGEQMALFLRQFTPYLTPEDEIARYELLEHTGPINTAKQQIERTPELWHALFYARLTNRFSTSDADALYQANAASSDPSLLYYRLKYLRLHDRLDEATSLWLTKKPGTASSPLLPPSPADWQTERANFVRALLRTGRVEAASTGFTIMQAIPPHQQTPETRSLMGYIAFTFLHNPPQAHPYFKALAEENDLNKHAEGLYWLARTEESLHPHTALEAYKKASNYPTTFYGQLALAHITHAPFLSSSLRNADFYEALQRQLRTLPPTPAGHNPAREDLLQASIDLWHEGDAFNAMLILAYLQVHEADDKAAQLAIARLALSLPLPKIAILATRQLARLGVAFYPGGYPSLPLASSPALPNGLLPALVRQESSMDEAAISPRHAIGLTQLLLPTAQQIIRQHHLSYKLTSAHDLQDPETNLTIGSLYLEDMLSRFNNVLPYTLAAYNAGPTRAKRWQDEMESPITPSVDDEDILLRWVLLLPYKETRLYIEHIEADMSLYALAPQ